MGLVGRIWPEPRFSDIQPYASALRIGIQPSIPLLGGLHIPVPGLTDFSRVHSNTAGHQARVQMEIPKAAAHLPSLPTPFLPPGKVLTPLSPSSTHTTLTPAQQITPTWLSLSPPGVHGLPLEEDALQRPAAQACEAVCGLRAGNQDLGCPECDQEVGITGLR